MCGQTGHLSKSCPDNPKGLYAAGKELWLAMFGHCYAVLCIQTFVLVAVCGLRIFLFVCVKGAAVECVAQLSTFRKIVQSIRVQVSSSDIIFKP